MEKEQNSKTEEKINNKTEVSESSKNDPKEKEREISFQIHGTLDLIWFSIHQIPVWPLTDDEEPTESQYILCIDMRSAYLEMS